MTTVRIPLDDAPGPGEIRMIDLGRHRVGVIRVGDAFHALADRCPHRGAPLCSSGRAVRGITLRDGHPQQEPEALAIRCPWHKWDFDIASGRCLVEPRMQVRRYQVTVEDHHIVVSLDQPRSQGHPDDRSLLHGGPSTSGRPVTRGSR